MVAEEWGVVEEVRVSTLRLVFLIEKESKLLVITSRITI